MLHWQHPWDLDEVESGISSPQMLAKPMGQRSIDKYVLVMNKYVLVLCLCCGLKQLESRYDEALGPHMFPFEKPAMPPP